MFKVPSSHLSASNSAVLASESFLVPITLRSEARTAQAAFEGLRQAFEDVKGFVPALTKAVPGVGLVGFEESVAPRFSRVSMAIHGKDHRFILTVALKCPIPREQDFWMRINFISIVYDRLTQLAAPFENLKGIELDLEAAKLEQQKDDPERARLLGGLP